MLVVPLSQDGFGETVVEGVPESEGEQFGDEVLGGEGHLGILCLTLALMLIVEDWVSERVSLRLALYSTLCSCWLSPVETMRVSHPFSILTGAAVAKQRVASNSSPAIVVLIRTCCN